MVEEERWKRNGGSRMVQEKMCNRKEGINVEERRGRGNVYYLFSGECRTFSIELRRNNFLVVNKVRTKCSRYPSVAIMYI